METVDMTKTLFVELFHVRLFSWNEAVQNADDLLDCTAHRITPMILQQSHFHYNNDVHSTVIFSSVNTSR